MLLPLSLTSPRPLKTAEKIFSRVVFPEPLGPRMPTISALSIERDTPSSTGLSWYANTRLLV
jgi:hypothetical protein